MIIGCFALVTPFTPMEQQFKLIRDMGIRYADLTDNHNGGMLGVEYGFTASMSLDSHPAKIRDMVAAAGITLTSVCAHANLLDPASPDRYGTGEIIKAVRLAHLLGVEHVITTDGDPKTEFGHKLTEKQRLFSIQEKLYEPVHWAAELGIQLLIEPHGIQTGTVAGMAAILEALGHEDSVGVCLDTGNSWLAGSEPLDYIKTFGQRIQHVHWKDLPAEMEAQRGTLYGCGMSLNALGDGVIDIPAIVAALKEIGFDGATTLEIAGEEAVKKSVQRLNEWSLS
jgi:inosose dehydratase